MLLFGALVVPLVLSCRKDGANLQIGFIGGFTGSVADLALQGCDGATLALEECNNRGGIAGKKVGLHIGDDKQQCDTIKKVIRSMVANNVLAIVGPMTNAMAEAAVPEANEAAVLLMSPIVNSCFLSGKDDYFYRVCPAGDQSARQLAAYMQQAQKRRIVGLLDYSNRSYSESFYRLFVRELSRDSTCIVDSIVYSTHPSISYAHLANRLVEKKTDGILLLCNSSDAAMVCRELSILGCHALRVCGEWSLDGDIVRQGAEAVEGLVFYQTFDRHESSPPFVAFKHRFIKRFGYEPAFASTYAYNAVTVILDAYRKNPDPRQLKATIKEIGTFDGLTDAVSFDSCGDVQGSFYLMRIENHHIKRVL